MKYRVIEQRMYEVEYLIESESEFDASRLDGEILEESATDSWGHDLVSVEEVEEDGK